MGAVTKNNVPTRLCFVELFGGVWTFTSNEDSRVELFNGREWDSGCSTLIEEEDVEILWERAHTEAALLLDGVSRDGFETTKDLVDILRSEVT